MKYITLSFSPIANHYILSHQNYCDLGASPIEFGVNLSAHQKHKTGVTHRRTHLPSFCSLPSLNRQTLVWSIHCHCTHIGQGASSVDCCSSMIHAELLVYLVLHLRIHTVLNMPPPLPVNYMYASYIMM